MSNILVKARKCLLRKLNLWKKKVLVSSVISGGFGITLHAVASELYRKGGFLEVLRPQGEYIGLVILAAGIWLSIVWLWRDEQ